MKISGDLTSGIGGAGLRVQAGAAVPRASTGSSTTPESVLERNYPGVVRALILMWGYPELTEFLDRVALGLDPRLRDIEPAALAELMLLARVHQSFCPPRKPQLGEGHPALRRGAWGLATQRP